MIQDCSPQVLLGEFFSPNFFISITSEPCEDRSDLSRRDGVERRSREHVSKEVPLKLTSERWEVVQESELSIPRRSGKWISLEVGKTLSRSRTWRLGHTVREKAKKIVGSQTPWGRVKNSAKCSHWKAGGQGVTWWEAGKTRSRKTN